MQSRRDFLRIMAYGTAGLGVLGAGVPAGAAGGSGARRPNIVVILADDMGFSDLGCYGGEIETPHLDRLAAEGLRFTQFYNAARCCPTRASLLTGLYPHQAGVGHMRADLGVPAYRGHLNDRCVTLAEVLRQGGYRTLMAGKWHLGKAYDQWPNARGFEHYTGLLDGASHYFDPPPNRTLVRDNEPYAPKHVGHFAARDGIDDDFYMTDFITDGAVRYLDAHGRGPAPFLLYVAYTAPHWPLHAPEAAVERYRGRFMEGWEVLRRRRYERQVAMGLVDPAWPLPPRDAQVPAWEEVADQEAWDRRMAVYAAMVDRMDQGVGRIVAKLEETGQLEHTLILFLSDNGASAEGVGRNDTALPGTPASYTGYLRPWAHLSDTPFRLYKQWVHEGGIATPCIAWGPGLVSERGAVSHEVGHVADVTATCLDAAGLAYPETFAGRPVTPMEGQSLLPLFRGLPRAGHDALYWSHMDHHAVRQGRWKLVSAGGPQAWELYDLAADRTELHDRAADFPGQVRALAERHAAWAERVGALPWEAYRALQRARG